MFERFTEKARRVVFFARYEASQFGSPCIETEHLLLGTLREDKTLANRFLPSGASVEAIRKQVEQATEKGEKVSTSVDLPLSHECKRVLAFGAEEAERLNHKHIGTVHLLLGLLREENCFAAQLLKERGLQLSSIRNVVAQNKAGFGEERDGPPRSLVFQPAQVQWAEHLVRRIGVVLAKRQQQGGITVARYPRMGYHEPDFAVFAGTDVYFEGEPLEEEGTVIDPNKPQLASPAGEIAALSRKIKLIVQHMENAIASHEFEKARFYSEEEHKASEELRHKRAQHKFPVDPNAATSVPFLCIELITEKDLLDALQERINGYFAAGVKHVWLFAPRRAYTATPSEGLREFRGTVLATENPALEIPLNDVLG